MYSPARALASRVRPAGGGFVGLSQERGGGSTAGAARRSAPLLSSTRVIRVSSPRYRGEDGRGANVPSPGLRPAAPRDHRWPRSRARGRRRLARRPRALLRAHRPPAPRRRERPRAHRRLRRLQRHHGLHDRRDAPRAADLARRLGPRLRRARAALELVPAPVRRQRLRRQGVDRVHRHDAPDAHAWTRSTARASSSRRASRPGARTWVETAPEGAPIGTSVSRFEVWYLA